MYFQGTPTPTDFSRNIGEAVGPAVGYNRSYSTRVFTAEARSTIERV
jgi:hypothetical protein